MLQPNQAPPKDCVFQTLPKFSLAVVGSAERAAGTMDAHRNEIDQGMANATMLLQRRLAEGTGEVIPIMERANLDPPTDNT